jgi:hypothetical protein
MCPNIRCDGESEKFCKIFWQLNRVLFEWIIRLLVFNCERARDLHAYMKVSLLLWCRITDGTDVFKKKNI